MDAYLGCWDKLLFKIFQCSVGPMLKWGGKYYMGFVENLILFPAVQKLWKYVYILKICLYLTKLSLIM